MRFALGFEPAGEGHLLAGVEVDAFGALDVQVAKERLVPPGKWQPGHRRGDSDIDPDHAGVEVAV